MKKFLLSSVVLIFLVAITGLIACNNENVPHEHVFNKQVIEQKFIANESTCVEKAKYYYSCSCGEKGEDTFEFGGLKEHDFSTIANDEKTHWKKCVCGEKIDVENHNFIGGICVCGKEQAKEHSHSFTELKFNETVHWQECLCGEKGQENPHSGGTATCEERAKCFKCETPYGAIKGHNYQYKYYGKDNGGNYNVTLECSKTDCKKVITAKANLKEIIEPNCESKGYTIYEYTFNDGLKDKKATINLDETEINGKHLLTIDGEKLKLVLNEDYIMNLLFKKAIEEDKIRTIAGVSANCTVYTYAVFDCEHCGYPIVINLSGDHVLGSVVNPCITKSYKECTLCDYVEYGNVLGHNYERTSSMKQENGSYEVELKCKDCKKAITAIATFKGRVEPSCEKGYDIYEYTYNNYVKNITQTFHINEKDPVFKHYVVCDGHKFEFELDGYYTQNETIEYLLEKGTIRWLMDIPVGVGNYEKAILDCHYCDLPFIINISGK